MNKKGTKLIFALAVSVFLGMGTAWAQVTYNGNGNSGFGDVLGNSSLEISDDGTTITFEFTKGAGSFGSPNAVIIYIDSKDGADISSTSNLTDNADGGRRGVSGLSGSDRATINFPSGFRPDYAISFESGFVGLFEIVESGSHTFVASGNLSGTAPYTFDFDFSEIGNDSLKNFSFVATYLNNSNAFRSDEAIGDGISSGNPGVPSSVTFSGTRSYQSGHVVTITGSAGWRLLSLPKTGGTVEDISDDTPVQGVTGGDDAGFDANFIIYDETGAFEQPTNVSTAWVDGLGFGVYFYDNTTNGSSELPVTLDASGAEPGSDVVVDLYSGATGRYTLVGNPFASNVDLANVSANIAISPNMTFWDNEAGSYTTENISGGLVIEPWQGYWVQTSSSGAGGQLTYGTADKTSSDADTTHFDKVVASTLKELSFELSSSYNTEKNLTLQVANDASLEWDNYDLLKLGSLKPQNISAAFVGKMDGDDVLKGIEAIPTSLDHEITIPILVDLTGESQTINMNWKGLADLPASWKIELNDYETGEIIDLRSVSEYEFEVIVPETQEKVNPLSVINNSFGKLMKAKTGSSPRLGITITPSTSVSNEPEDKPFAFGLEQNYPNPFNPSTTIKYSVGETGPVSITVYNVMGQKVAELINATRGAGEYQVTWNADAQASGIYYYRLVAPGQVITRQMTLIK